MIDQKLRQCEIDLFTMTQKIQIHEEQIKNYLQKLNQTEIPLNGHSMLFRELYESKRTYLFLIDEEKEEIARLIHLKKQKEEENQQLLFEKEKMVFLQQKERQKILKLLKQREQNHLDEIATISYYNNRSRR